MLENQYQQEFLKSFMDPREFFPREYEASQNVPINSMVSEFHLLGPYQCYLTTTNGNPLYKAIFDTIAIDWVMADKYCFDQPNKDKLDYRYSNRVLEFKSTDCKNNRRARITFSSSDETQAFFHLFTVTKEDDEKNILAIKSSLSMLCHKSIHQTLGAYESIAKWIKDGECVFDIAEAAQAYSGDLN